MSHTTALKAVEMRNTDILLATAKKLNIEHLGHKEYTLYDGSKHTGHGFQLKDYKYPVVIDTETGIAACDTFGGSWGKQEELDIFVQEYAAESNRRQALEQGYLVQEEYLENGDLVQSFETMATGY